MQNLRVLVLTLGLMSPVAAWAQSAAYGDIAVISPTATLSTNAPCYWDGQFVACNNSAAITGLVQDRIVSGTTGIYASNNTSLSLATAGTERVVIGTGGNVGIGQQPSTSATLAVNGGFMASGPAGYSQILEGGSSIARLRLKTPSSFESGLQLSEASLVSLYNGGAQISMNSIGRGGVGMAFTVDPSVTWHVSGTLRVANGGEACDADRLGSIRYASSTIQVCQNTTNGWQSLSQIANASVQADRITSGTTGVYASNNTSVSIATAGVERMVVGSGGAIGIATQPYSDSAMTVSGTLKITRSGGGVSQLSFGNESNQGAQADILVDGGHNIIFKQRSGGSFNETARFKYNGLNGLGTSDPRVRLDVSGTLRIATGGEACDADRLGGLRYASSTIQVCQNTTDGWQSLSQVATASVQADRITSGTTGVYATNNTSVSIATGGTERMVVGTAGNVGIGQQPIATAALVVSGTVSSTAMNTGNLLMFNPQTGGVGLEASVTTPGGADTNVQYNNGGAFAGSSGFTWTNASNRLTATNISATAATITGAGINTLNAGTIATTGNVTVSGSVKFANDATTCTSGIAGTIRYNGTAFESCNGTAWATFGAATSLSETVAINDLKDGASTPASGTVYLGSTAGGTSTGTSNTVVGIKAFSNGTTGGNNTIMGAQAMPTATTAGNNVSVGFESMFSTTYGGQNVAIGTESLRGTTDGSSNVAIGFQSMRNSSGNQGNNVAIGYGSMFYGGNYSVAIGTNSMQNGGGDKNVSMGYESGLNNSSGSDNTNIGYQAGRGSTGKMNTYLGSGAGTSMSSGERNILIGYNTSAPSPTTSYYLNIGNLLFGDISTSKAGIGTLSAAQFTVSGTVSATAMNTGSAVNFAGQTGGAGTDPSVTTSGGTPGGSDTQVQYNDNGAFAGSSNMVWTNASNRLTVTNISATAATITGAGINTLNAGTIATTGNVTVSGTVSASNVTANTWLAFGGQAGGAGTDPSVTASGGTPGGSDAQIQFNNAGAFAGSSGLLWDNANSRLTATNISATAATITGAGINTLNAGTIATMGNVTVSGSVRLANDTAACAAGNAGAMRYSSSTISFCNGTAWAGVSSGVAAASPTNVPAFHVTKTASQSSGSSNDVIIFNNKVFDTFNNFDTGTNRFTPQVAGNYLFRANLGCGGGSYCQVEIQKNGTSQAVGYLATSNSSSAGVDVIIPMNGTTDYVQVVGYINPSGVAYSINPAATNFSGSLLASGNGSTTATTPGGSNTQVQFNNNGAFAGSSGLLWDNTNTRLTATNISATAATITGAGINTLNAGTISTTGMVSVTGIYTGSLLSFGAQTGGAGTDPSVTASGGGTPGGSNTQVQFNNSGAFAGSSGLLWDDGNSRLTSTNVLVNGELAVGNMAFSESSDSKSASAYAVTMLKPNNGNKDAVLRFTPSGSATNSVFELYSSSAMGGGNRAIFKVASSGIQIGGDSGGLPIDFIMYNQSKMRIGSDGKIGIGGITAPNAGLDVSGTGAFSGNLSVPSVQLGTTAANHGDSCAGQEGKMIRNPTTKRLMVCLPN